MTYDDLDLRTQRRAEVIAALPSDLRELIKIAPPSELAAADQEMNDGLYPPQMLVGALLMADGQWNRCEAFVYAQIRAYALLRMPTIKFHAPWAKYL
jgi:hypothetical protein